MYTYTFPMLCIELPVVRIETKFCRNSPHNKKGLAGLFLTSALDEGEQLASSSDIFTPRISPPPHQYSLERKQGGPQNWSGGGGEEGKSHHCRCLELNPCRPIRSLVTLLTELPRLC
jgi:hypothetical protein